MSKASLLFEHQLNESGIRYDKEYRFYPTRRWRFDYAIPAIRLAIEIEGAVYTGGRHTRGKGFTSDCEKYSHAAIEKWYLLRATTQQVMEGKLIKWVKQFNESY